MSLTRFPHGISSFGVPVIGSGGYMTTGNVFFVDDSGSDDSALGRDPERPFATLDYAIGQCTASQGDTIFVMPGHAETTTAIAADIAGITIIGLGQGRARPTFTANTTASSLLAVSAANVTVRNIRFVGAASGVTSHISLSAAADDFVCEDCVFDHGAAPLISVIVAAGADRFRFSRCLWLGTAANPDASIDIQGTGDNNDWTVEDCTFNYDGSAGLDEAAIRTDKTNTGVIVSRCRFIGMDATAIDFNSSASGMLEFLSVDTTKATIAELFDIGQMTAIECYAGAATKKGTDIPAATAAD